MICLVFPDVIALFVRASDFARGASIICFRLLNVTAIVDFIMAQPLSSMMGGLSLGDPSSPTPQPRNPSSAPGQQNRLPPVLKRYMNPGLTRPANTGLAAHSAHAESIRGPLFKLAGVNNPPPSSASGSLHPSQSQSQYHQQPSGKHASPKSKLSLTQHTAHGLHGPAHSTTARALSSAISTQPASAHPSGPAATSKGGIGKYDGGLEVDDGKEAITGEAAKILELESGWVILCFAAPYTSSSLSRRSSAIVYQYRIWSCR